MTVRDLLIANLSWLIHSPPTATCEMVFDEDIPRYLAENTPRIPADADGDGVQGRFVGNRNWGRIGGNGKNMLLLSTPF